MAETYSLRKPGVAVSGACAAHSFVGFGKVINDGLQRELKRLESLAAI